MTSATGRGSRLAELHRRVAARVSGLGDEAAAAWIAGHGLLSMHACEELPDGVRERLRDRSRHVAAYNLFAIERFRALADAFGAGPDPIPLCPLKGIYLLDSIYGGDPGSRPLSDLDLLVPAERIDEAVERVQARLGFEELQMTKRLRRIYHSRVLRGDRLEIDLHARLGYKHGSASSWVELAPKPATVHGHEVYALDREITLVHLVTHLVKHRPLSRLSWVEDVLRWCGDGVGGRRIDCGRAGAIASRLGARRSFAAGLRVLRRVVGDGFLSQVPTEGGLSGRAIVLHERWLWRDLTARADGELPDPPDPRKGGSARTRSAGVLSAVLLADRPSQALRAVGVKAAEVALRGGGRRTGP